MSGLLVASPEAMEAAMLHALSNPKDMEAMAQYALLEVVPRFSVAAFGTGLNALYDGILHG